MNRIKSFYITVYCTAVMLAGSHTVYELAVNGPRLSWLASAVTVLPMMLLFIYIFIAGKARLSRHLPQVLIPSLAGAVLACYAALTDFSPVPFIYAIFIGLGGFLLYNYWYSRFDRSTKELETGNMLPDVTFEDESGTLVSSSSFLGKPALLMFYRGNWCPFCTAQVKEISAQYNEFAARGVQVVFVSPQPHENTRQLAERFNVDCHFLVDKGNKAAEALDIVSIGGTPAGMEALGYDTDTVMPTVIITDAEGKIIFADLTDNYRVRPEPQTFLAALDAAGI